MGDSLVMNSQAPQNQGGFMYLTPLSSMQMNAAQPLGPQIQVMPAGAPLLQQGANIVPLQPVPQIHNLSQSLPGRSVQSQATRLPDGEKALHSARQPFIEPSKTSNRNEPAPMSAPTNAGSSAQEPRQMTNEQNVACSRQPMQGSDATSGDKGKSHEGNDLSVVASSQGAKLVTLSGMNQIVTLPFSIDKSFIQGPPSSTGSTQLLTLLTAEDAMTSTSNSCSVPLLSAPFPVAHTSKAFPGSMTDAATAQSGSRPQKQSSQDLQVAPFTPGTHSFHIAPQDTVIDLTALGPSDSPHAASPAACSSLVKLHAPGASSPRTGMHVVQTGGVPTQRQMNVPERLLASLAMSGVDVCGGEESETLFNRVMNI